MIELYVFDLDGTIIDSALDLANGVNKTLEYFGFNTISNEKLISFVGNGAKKLMERSLLETSGGKFNINSEKFNEILRWYIDFYAKNPVIKTKLYDGVKDLLSALFSRNKKIALLTNKPSKVAVEILEKLDVIQFFHLITGPEQLSKIKPNPEGLEMTLSKINENENLRLKKENTAMIGDSYVDVQTGKAFGCLTVGVTGGIGNAEQLISEKPDILLKNTAELLSYIDSL